MGAWRGGEGGALIRAMFTDLCDLVKNATTDFFEGYFL
jgi:hypothetical protein